jgi:hypothetical protein
MNLSEALEQIDAIHAHLARGEEYRGYRPQALALSGAAGLAAAVAQPAVVVDACGFVAYWLAVALACAVVAGGGTLFAYFFREAEAARKRTRVVLRQFLPCLFVGAVITLGWTRSPVGEGASLLPGLWALVYGLGVVASLPFLPRAAALVAVWYLAAGGAMLAALDGPVPPGWSVGVPFGVGQLLAALVLVAARPRGEQP